MAELNSPFAKRMMAQKLMMDNKTNPFEQSEFFQPSDALEAPRVTGMLLPFSARRFGDEKDLRLAVPELVSDFFDATVGNTGKALRGELGVPSVNNPAFTGAVADMGMNVTGGSLLGSALTKSVPKNALSMGLKATKAVDDVKPGDIAKVVPPTDKSDGIFAFHGSGADFDEFKLSKIGTGEGNQAFGYGLYFTDSEDIAKFYKNTVTFQDQQRKRLNFEYKGEKFIDLGDTAQAENASTEYRVLSKLKEDMASYLPANPKLATPEEAKNRLLKRLDVEIDKYSKAGQRDSSVGSIDLADGSKLEDLITKSLQNEKDALLKIDPDDIKVITGKTYKVNIKAVTDDLLDYDKPLSEQPKKIQEALKKIDYKFSETSTGSDIYDIIAVKFMKVAGKERTYDDKKVSELLNSLGIKGIKYLDNSARNTFGGKILSVDKTPDGFRAKVVLDDSTRQTGVGGTGRVITTSQPYKTEKEARDWAKKSTEKESRNYVIFDDKIIDIMAKYGIVGAIGVSAMKGINGGSESNTLPSDA